MRENVCNIFAEMDLSARSAGNLSAEWVLHNQLYYTFYFIPTVRKSAVHADLDFDKDSRPVLQFLTNLYDWIGIWWYYYAVVLFAVVEKYIQRISESTDDIHRIIFAVLWLAVSRLDHERPVAGRFFGNATRSH